MGKVLVLDDDLSLVQLVADVVKFCGHDPVAETDPLEACARHAVTGSTIAAVITDLMMPRLNGIEVCALFAERCPDTRRIVLTAAPFEQELREATTQGIVHSVISKPPTISDIRLALAWLDPPRRG